ncbi:MAG: membrane protein insertion efficiency factor YidD [bacterium]
MDRKIIQIIGAYRVFSSLFPARCRFYPTCSEYAQQAIAKYGLTKGLFLALKRILRCHPYHNGGVDYP